MSEIVEIECSDGYVKTTRELVKYAGRKWPGSCFNCDPSTTILSPKIGIKLCKSQFIEYVIEYISMRHSHRQLIDCIHYWDRNVTDDALKIGLAKPKIEQIYCEALQELFNYCIITKYYEYMYESKIDRVIVSATGKITFQNTRSVKLQMLRLWLGLIDGYTTLRIRVRDTYEKYLDNYRNNKIMKRVLNGSNLDTSLLNAGFIKTYTETGDVIYETLLVPKYGSSHPNHYSIL